jgi:hypothetical protein
MSPLPARIAKIVLSPQTEWPAIWDRPATTSSLLTGYALPLAFGSQFVAPLVGAVAVALFGVRQTGGAGFLLATVVTQAIAGLVKVAFEIAMLWLFSLVVPAFAPSVNAQMGSLAALKLAVYARTPAWLGSALSIVPFAGLVLGWIGSFAGFVYGLVLVYLGTISFMRVPRQQAGPFPIVNATIVFGLQCLASFATLFISVIVAGLAAFIAASHSVPH